METKKCSKPYCSERHPKEFKWDKSACGYKRKNCDYLHGIIGEVTTRQIYQYKCEGCKHTWEDTNHVVEHNIFNMKAFFCLNCDDWIKNKNNVFNQGWLLFDNSEILDMMSKGRKINVKIYQKEGK